jgi:NADPH:quinone reductase-like Zn-dependent oxidoreductase
VRAIQITEFGSPADVVRVVDLEEPPAPGPGEVKVAVETRQSPSPETSRKTGKRPNTTPKSSAINRKAR